MSVAGLIFALVLTAFVLVVLIAPFLSKRQDADQQAALTNLQRERLQVYYDRVLRNIRDLDEDHALGKINEDDYVRDRELWAQRGVQALKALDALETQSAQSSIAPTAAESGAVDHAIDDAIEAAIRKARQPQEQPAP